MHFTAVGGKIWFLLEITYVTLYEIIFDELCVDPCNCMFRSSHKIVGFACNVQDA